MVCKVRKRFEAHGRNLAPGTVVDTSEWRLERQLLDQRYLVPAPEAKLIVPRKYKKRSKAGAA